MGKISDALDKYKKEKLAAPRPQKLKPGDYEALLQYDPKTDRLDLKHPLVVSDPGTVDRLITFRLVESDGTLTPAGKARCEELKALKSKTKDSQPPSRTPEKTQHPEPKPTAEWQEIEIGVSETERKAVLQPTAGEKDETKPADRLPADTGKSAKPAHRPALAPPEPESMLTGSTKLRVIKKKAAPEIKSPAGTPAASRPPVRSLDPSLVVHFKPQSFEAEQFKILRSNLLYPVSGTPPRSVMITSLMPGEGKSFVASNLAISVARNINRHVLLMDCDLRRPTIHSRFGYTDVPGLSDYLANGTALPNLLLHTAIDNLTILPGGSPPDNPSELLSSERMSALLEEASERYDDRLIILDSPPPVLTAETSVLARWVDGVIIIIKHASTPRDGVADVIEKMGKAKILGAVINSFEVYSSRYYGKYYGKGKYYGYPQKDKKHKKETS